MIINKPGLQTLRRRFGYSLVTFLFWLIWFYLWMPLISLVGWVFGVDLFYEQMVVQEGLQALLDLLGWYLLVILLISLTLGLWALVNLLRFRGNDRRGVRTIVNDESLANDFSVTSKQLGQWRDSKRLVISHDVNGEIDEVETLPVTASYGEHRKDEASSETP